MSFHMIAFGSLSTSAPSPRRSALIPSVFTGRLSFVRQPCLRTCYAKHGRQTSAVVVPVATVSVGSRSTRETIWFQKKITVPPVKRGCHIITRQLLSALEDIKLIRIGLVNFFVLHTSASLTINENASPDVPVDLNDSLDRIVPEGNFYLHDDEGPDDMPAHVKSSLMGPSLTVPIVDGRLGLGIWQGIYLNEHRNYGGSRAIIATIHGESQTKETKH